MYINEGFNTCFLKIKKVNVSVKGRSDRIGDPQGSMNIYVSCLLIKYVRSGTPEIFTPIAVHENFLLLSTD